MTLKKTLVWLKPRFIGDAVMATPFLQLASEIAEHADVWAASHLTELLYGCPSILKLHPVGKVKGYKGFVDQVRRVRSQGYDTALVVNRSFRSALITRFAGVPIRVGHTTEGRGPLLTHRVLYSDTQFEADSYLDLLRVLGVEVKSKKLQLWLSEEERSKASNFVPLGAVGIQPGSTAAYKALSTEAVTYLIRQLTDRGQSVILLGGKDEIPYLDGLPLDLTINLVGKCSLRETMITLSGLSHLVSGDTGLVHICVGLGTPTLAAFGPTPSSKWGHDYPPHQVIKWDGPDLSKLSGKDILEAYDKFSAN